MLFVVESTEVRMERLPWLHIRYRHLLIASSALNSESPCPDLRLHLWPPNLGPYRLLLYKDLRPSILWIVGPYSGILFRGLRPEAGNAGSRGDLSHILSFVAHTCARLSPLQKLDLLKKREREREFDVYIYIYIIEG